MAEATLTIEIKNKDLVELIDFTSSLYSLANEYSKFLSEANEFKLDKETKLYIKEVRQGSIVTVLQDMAIASLPFVENVSSIIEFTKFLNKITAWLLGKDNEKPKVDNTDLRNVSNILKPIAKDKASQIFFTGKTTINNLVQVTFSLDSIEANAIQNQIRSLLEESKQPDTNIHRKVLFYWDTTKYGEKSNAVDRGIIDSIYDKPLKVIFEPDDLKNKMIDSEKNPFHLGFIVDVEVQTMQNIPTVYKIMAVHESIDKPL